MTNIIPFRRASEPLVQVLQGACKDAHRWFLAFSETGNPDRFTIVSDRETLPEILEDARLWREGWNRTGGLAQ